jgi:hypothetical protein
MYVSFMNPEVGKYLSKIGKKGGSVSRRKLSAEQARAMVTAKKQKKAGFNNNKNTKGADNVRD